MSIGDFEKLSLFEAAILDLFYQFFWFIPLKTVKLSSIWRIEQNFHDDPGFQPKITNPKYFSRQCISQISYSEISKRKNISFRTQFCQNAIFCTATTYFTFQNYLKHDVGYNRIRGRKTQTAARYVYFRSFSFHLKTWFWIFLTKCKGGLISESFSLWLQSPRKCAKKLFLRFRWIELKIVIRRTFWEIENLSEI